MVEQVGRDRYQNVRWSCLCTCGKVVYVVSGNLVTGNTKSCGCKRKEAYQKAFRKAPGESGFHSLLTRYRCCAGYKKQSWMLTKEEFRTLTKNDCFYCGTPPAQISKNGGPHSSYVYNGVDRVDSSLGYEITNCVTACKRCNQAKNDMSLSEFLAWIRAVSARTESLMVP